MWSVEHVAKVLLSFQSTSRVGAAKGGGRGRGEVVWRGQNKALYA